MLRDGLDTKPIWTNSDLVLYHGTSLSAAEEIRKGPIDVFHGEHGKDFGRGFYTTTVLQQAETWAKIVVARPGNVSPAKVVEITLNRAEIAKMCSLTFVLGGEKSEDFWSFVRHCRSHKSGHRRASPEDYYDIVIGPLVSSWQHRKLWLERDQISFHTSHAEFLLNKLSLKKILEVR